MLNFKIKKTYEKIKIYPKLLVSLVLTTVGVILVSMKISVGSIFIGGSHTRTVFMAEEIGIQISALLGDPGFCVAHFGGVEISETNFPIDNFAHPIEFKNIDDNGKKNNRDILKIGTRYKNIVDVKDLQARVNSQLAENKFEGSLKISMQGRSEYSSTIEKSIPIQFVVDSEKKVVYCSRPHLDEVIEETPKNYSLTCNDHAHTGWKDRNECLHDGRWHKVYSAPPSTSGLSPQGSLTELASLIQGGASVRTAITGTAFGITYENCFAVSIHDGLQKVFCAGGARSGVGDWQAKIASISNMQDDTGETSGGVGYFTDGYLDFNTDTIPLFPAGTDWFIKF